MKRKVTVLVAISALVISFTAYELDQSNQADRPVSIFRIPAERSSSQDKELYLIADYVVQSENSSSLVSGYTHSLVDTITNLAWTHDSEYLAAFTSLGSSAHMLDFRDKRPDALGHSRVVSTHSVAFNTAMGRTFFIGNTHILVSPQTNTATLRTSKSVALTTLDLDTDTIGTIDGPVEQAEANHRTWKTSASLDGKLVAYTTVPGENAVVYRNGNWQQPEIITLPKASSLAERTPDFDHAEYARDIDTDTLTPLGTINVSASGRFIAVALWHVFSRPDGSKDGPVFVGVLDTETDRLISLGRCPSVGSGSLDDIQFAPGESEIAVASRHSTISFPEHASEKSRQAQVSVEQSQSCILETRSGRVQAILPSGSSGRFMTSWSASGSIITDWDRKNILAVDAQGTRSRILSEPAGVLWEEWSPDGKYLALAWGNHVSVYGVSLSTLH